MQSSRCFYPEWLSISATVPWLFEYLSKPRDPQKTKKKKTAHHASYIFLSVLRLWPCGPKSVVSETIRVDSGKDGKEMSTVKVLLHLNNIIATQTPHSVTSMVDAELLGLCVFCRQRAIMMKGQRTRYRGHLTWGSANLLYCALSAPCSSGNSSGVWTVMNGGGALKELNTAL